MDLLGLVGAYLGGERDDFGVWMRWRGQGRRCGRGGSRERRDGGEGSGESAARRLRGERLSWTRRELSEATDVPLWFIAAFEAFGIGFQFEIEDGKARPAGVTYAPPDSSSPSPDELLRQLEALEKRP